MAEKKEYRSAVRSRRLIREAFQQLLREKPFEKITVTDIVGRADINRLHLLCPLSGCPGAGEELLDEVVTKSTWLVASTDYRSIFEDPRPFLADLLHIGMENMELYKLVGNSDFALRQVEILKTSLLEKAISAVDIPEHIRCSNAYRIQINFFIGGILNTYQQWMVGTLECSPEEIMEQIAQLILNNADMYRSWGTGKVQ